MSQARCDSCRYWTPPSERTDDYRSAVAPEYRRDIHTERDWDADEEAAQQADALMGECGGVPERPTVSELPSPAASVVDGEDYFARLYTAADFFCALWQPKEQP